MTVETLDIAAASRIILDGGVVAVPTEAVYGLSCDPWNEAAVTRLLELKQRERDKGLILVAGGLYQLSSLVEALDPQQQQQLIDTWPGPVTWLLPVAAKVPDWISGGHASVAVRVTAHPEMAELCRVTGKPLVSTSANRSGEAPARSKEEVAAAFPALDGMVAGELGGASSPSEIRDLLSGEIIRPA